MKKAILITLVLASIALFIVGCQPGGEAIAGRQARARTDAYFVGMQDQLPSAQPPVYQPLPSQPIPNGEIDFDPSKRIKLTKEEKEAMGIATEQPQPVPTPSGEIGDEKRIRLIWENGIVVGVEYISNGQVVPPDSIPPTDSFIVAGQNLIEGTTMQSIDATITMTPEIGFQEVFVTTEKPIAPPLNPDGTTDCGYWLEWEYMGHTYYEWHGVS